jgi:energy-coupling factor transport system substrate-specific component
MREVFGMWKHTKMVVLVALSAAIYAAVLIPFKGFVLIPGITEFRPGSAFPVLLGLLFGPAGAWGSAIGNLIGDFFGTLGIGSLFGFVGNFLFAYVPYKLWNKFGLVSKDDENPLELKDGKKIANYVIVGILGSMACALFIGWGLDLLKMVPFAALGVIIALNNSIPTIVLGIPLMLVLYPRIKKWDLLWTDIMDEEAVETNVALSRIGAVLMVVGVVGGWLLALLAALGFGDQVAFQFQGSTGTVGVVLLAGIGSILTLIGGAMQQ